MSIYDFKLKTIDGLEKSLSDYRGKVLLVVNVASQCGFTPQYSSLEELYKKFSGEGLVILGFPCNQFGNQEPGSDEEIKNFCSSRFQVTFPLFSKVEVNGPQAEPLFQYLKSEAPGLLRSEAIKWNFTKFLVDKSGKVIERFAPITTPQAIESKIRALLEK